MAPRRRLLFLAALALMVLLALATLGARAQVRSELGEEAKRRESKKDHRWSIGFFSNGEEALFLVPLSLSLSVLSVLSFLCMVSHVPSSASFFFENQNRTRGRSPSSRFVFFVFFRSSLALKKKKEGNRSVETA